MTKLLVIADDFTGTLDTGIQLVRKGIKTSVVIGTENVLASRAEYPVVVVDTESRHLKPTDAYEKIFKLASEAKSLGIDCVYKKTDSALRGCVGAELSAALDAWDAKALEFVPAFPKTKRITKDGTQFIDGVPVSESAFGRDPFEPVRHSFVPDILADQTKTPVILAGKDAEPECKHIVLHDAATDEDLAAIAEQLKAKGTTLMSGCAGFAAQLDSIVGLETGKADDPKKTDGMFIVCGSLNSISEEQVIYAEDAGFKRIHLSTEQILEPDYLSSPEGQEWLAGLKKLCEGGIPVMLDSFKCHGDCDDYAAKAGISTEQLRAKVAHGLGEITREWTNFNLNHTLVVIGGDTLSSFMGVIGCNEVTPTCEMSAGVVCSVLKWSGHEVQIISKSGGFGYKEVLTDIEKTVCEK